MLEEIHDFLLEVKKDVSRSPASSKAFLVIDAAIILLFGLVIMPLERSLKYFSNRKTAMPPMYILSKLTQFLLPKKYFDHYFAQMINDAREEIFDCYAKGQKWRPRWLTLVYSVMFLYTFAAFFVVEAARKLVGVWNGPSS